MTGFYMITASAMKDLKNYRLLQDYSIYYSSHLLACIYYQFRYMMADERVVKTENLKKVLDAISKIKKKK